MHFTQNIFQDIFTETLRIMFNQIAGHSHGPVKLANKIIHHKHHSYVAALLDGEKHESWELVALW